MTLASQAGFPICELSIPDKMTQKIIQKLLLDVRIQSEELLNRWPHSQDDYENIRRDTEEWDARIRLGLRGNIPDGLFSHYSRLGNLPAWTPFHQYWAHTSNFRGPRIDPFEEPMKEIVSFVKDRISALETIMSLLSSYNSAFDTSIRPKIFIGHGHSPQWRVLKDFLVNEIKVDYGEYNCISTAGMLRSERIDKLLDQCVMAFLIMTAEDEQADGSFNARQNVPHEIGLCQQKYGRQRAIVFLEEGCNEFSNLAGLDQIRFQANNIESVFEQVRQIIRREKIVNNMDI